MEGKRVKITRRPKPYPALKAGQMASLLKPVMASLREGEGEGVLFQNNWMVGVGEYLMVWSPLPTGVAGCVNGKLLFEFVHRLPPEEALQCRVEDLHLILESKDKPRKLKMNLISEVWEPWATPPKLEEFLPLEESFFKDLELALGGLEVKSLIGPLAGVWVGENKVLATDECRANMLQRQGGIYAIKPGLLFSARALDCLLDLKLTCNGWLLDKDRRWVWFSTLEGILCAVRLMQSEEYPTQALVELFSRSRHYVSFPVSEFGEAVDLAHVVAKHSGTKNLIVSLIWKGNTLTIVGRGEFGSFEQSMNWKKDSSLPDEGGFDVNPVLLKNMIEGSIEAKFGLTETLVFVEGEDFQYLAPLIWKSNEA